jgi:hypothetical protein
MREERAKLRAVLQSTFADDRFEPYRKPLHRDEFPAEMAPVMPRTDLFALLPA